MSHPDTDPPDAPAIIDIPLPDGYMAGEIEGPRDGDEFDPSLQNLRQQAAKGAILSAASGVCYAGGQFVTSLILARMLNKSDFGMVAIATAFSTIAYSLTEAGFGRAMIQEGRVKQAQVSNLFWIGLLVGVSLCGIFVLVAPFVAYHFQDDRLRWVMPISGLSFVLSALPSQPLAIIWRRMQFVEMALITAVYPFVAGGISLFIAWRWNSYWALVIGPLAAQGLRAAMAFYWSHWIPSWPRRRVGTRKLAVFGMHVTIFAVINHFARSIDNLMVGYFYGPATLGTYSRAYMLMTQPMQQIGLPITNVAVPILSRLRDDAPRYRANFLRMNANLFCAAIPLAVFCFVGSDTVVRSLLGDKWADAGPIFAAMSLGAIPYIWTFATGWLFLSQDRAKELSRWGAISTTVQVIGMFCGLPFGPLGIAWGYAAVWTLVLTPWLVHWVGRSGPIGPQDMWRLLGDFVPLGLLCGLGGALAEWSMPSNWPTLARFFLDAAAVGVGALVFGLTTRVGRGVLEDYVVVTWNLLRRSGNRRSRPEMAQGDE